MIIYLGRFIRKSAKNKTKKNNADKNINTGRSIHCYAVKIT